MSAPRFVALCGAPKSGKSTIAELLRDRYGAMIVDDGMPLRRAVMDLYGLSWEDVSTQEGKAREIEVCGKTYQVRHLLGDLGNMLEGFYSQQFMPERAIASITQTAPFYVFPSCRKTQGLTYRQHGGLVIEVYRPGYEPVNDFDHWDQSLCTHIAANDTTLEALEQRVIAFFDEIYTPLAARQEAA